MIFYLHQDWDASDRFFVAFTPAWFSDNGEPDGYARVKVFGSFTYLGIDNSGVGRLEPLHREDAADSGTLAAA